MQDDPARSKTGSGDPNEAPEPVAQLSSVSSRRRILHVVVVDLLVLAELAVAVVLADRWRAEADFTLAFCGVFFGLVIPTILISRRVARSSTPAEPEEPGAQGK